VNSRIIGRRVTFPQRVWLLPAVLAGYIAWASGLASVPIAGRALPFVALWLGVSAVAAVAWLVRSRSIKPLAVAAILVTVAMVLTDIRVMDTQVQRDAGIYVKAGTHWRTGADIYTTTPLVAAPRDRSDFPYLYPPPTVPVFGVLSLLPRRIAFGLWILLSVAALLVGLRLVGMSWRWSALMLVWPPVLQGLWVGNVAVPLFLFFAVAPWRPAALVVGPIFKIYSGIASLWLLRREHWRSLVIGVAAVVLVSAVSLPLVGVDLWRDWATALVVFQETLRNIPPLYGFGLGRYLPVAVVAVLAVLVLVLALRARDRLDQLARLGVATIVASPSLYSHGFLVAIPAMLALSTPWFWLAFGATASAPTPTWFLAIIVIIASWFVPGMRKVAVNDAWHPLGAAPGPWPTAPLLGGRSAHLPAEQTPVDDGRPAT
jgi:glycosyl transferase family 87